MNSVCGFQSKFIHYSDMIILINVTFFNTLLKIEVCWFLGRIHYRFFFIFQYFLQTNPKSVSLLDKSTPFGPFWYKKKKMIVQLTAKKAYINAGPISTYSTVLNELLTKYIWKTTHDQLNRIIQRINIAL